eukprot:Plantae.Rhodophyta-Purpureofilum_apyrenoidigerum.ctg6096.p1 GENE.Plantae.Rhodophyta-Purpureofilum_apyrenoidigerum.ctg6096~~Plantae.Rhodophyta-Purpureofilum_apyrenoidigerum.ctg6096.p1  ORF type:complete len:383 (+),score=53.92 Plantae.Rhodophyta-Purpureofilum_apyrenoidigerum.ctg6096:212-1360(+)
MVTHLCGTPGCDKAATLRCPTCVKLSLPEENSYFCSQECFKSSWKLHKLQHAQPLGRASGRRLDTAEKQKLAFANFQYTGDLRVGYVSPTREMPSNISRPDYADTSIPISEQTSRRASTIVCLGDKEIKGMRKVCRLAREVLDIAGAMVKPGVTPEEIDAAVHQACIERNSYPSPLNYYSFPKSVCTSVNEVICHGIPDDRPLKNGDIVNIDVTLYHNGYHGDLNETYLVGDVNEAGRKLVKSAYDSLMAAIRIVKPGTMFREFGAEIEKVANSNKHAVVRSYCGHGINQLFHPAPSIPHYKKNKAIGICKPGQTFTIEPMLCEGTGRDVTWPDNWTAVTADGKRSAQFEHTILVTEKGYELLTGKLPSSPKYFWEVEDEDQ